MRKYKRIKYKDRIQIEAYKEIGVIEILERN